MLQVVLTTVAMAGVPVSLPESEDQAEWSSALTLAGLEPMGDEPRGPAAWIREEAEAWSVRVRDTTDAEHLLSVSIPADQAAREALALLVSSLATPLGVAEPVPAPAPTFAPAPAPVVPATQASPRSTASAVQEERTAAADELVAAEPPEQTEPGEGEAPDEAAAASPRRIVWPPLTVWRPQGPRTFEAGASAPATSVRRALPRWWFAVSPVLRLRTALRSVAGGQLWVGVRPRSLQPLKVAVGAQVSPSALMLRVDDRPRRMQTTVVAAGAWLEVRGFEAGPVVALSRRSFVEPGQPPIVTWLPLLGVRGAYAVELGPMTLPLSLDVWFDVIRTELSVDSSSRGDLPRVGVTLSAGIGSR
ncbi:MAG: hypothetical protein KTR31_14840 [Myxococcales bacterium]|nr:hypothetical protein [Myxococcales bacterium]